MTYQVSTVEGQSGAPLIMEHPNGTLTIVGIHCGSTSRRVDEKEVEFNSGLLITEKIVE